MSKVICRSEVPIERVKGPVRKAYLPAEATLWYSASTGLSPNTTRFRKLF